MSTTKRFETIECVAVGDPCIGKTSLLTMYSFNLFPEDLPFVPHLSDYYAGTVSVDGKLVNLKLWDTCGQEDYDKLRPLTYPNKDVVLICFSLDMPSSRENIRWKWLPEISHHARNKPFLLVGTKLDLSDAELSENERKDRQEKGRLMAKEIGAVKYMECSALKNIGLKEVFYEAVNVALFPPAHLRQERKGKCEIS